MLRLTGSCSAGSIPAIGVGLIVLFLMAFHYFVVLLMVIVDKKGGAMNKTRRIRLFGISILDTFWAIGTSAVAGVLLT